MAHKLYVVIVHWHQTPQIQKLEVALGSVGDWLRFSNSSWIIHSQKTPRNIFDAIAPAMHKNDSELIFEINRDSFSGWAKPWVDNWVKDRWAK